ncbi:Putative E3 ubiquitin-protein ligase HERC4 [Glycine soja]|nr:Putative E3 ubiquitin-protein ligase HERC4 [Glycine soja]
MMDATTSGTPTIQYHNIPDQPITAIIATPLPTFQRQQRHCFGDSTPGEFPLSANPSIVLHVLTACNLDPQDLAKLEASATCSFFRQPANFAPDSDLSLSELAALDMCQKRAIFKPMTTEQRQDLKLRCGGSWKLVLRYLMAGEACCRREKSQAIAGPGHSIAVTSKGIVYSFGSNSSGQLGHGTTEEEWRPRPIRTLQGIRIIQAAAGAGRTMLVSDSGQVYAFGEAEYGVQGSKTVAAPQIVEISSWFPLHYCYLLCLACQPSGMSVYSVGCGLGGKLGHGSRTDEEYPRLIEQFGLLNLQPMVVAAGAWHAAVVGRDGRVCTWGWGRYGCLGHGNEECESVPKVVEALSNVKAVHVATGDYTTFVVSDDGDVYSFGCGQSASLGHNAAGNDEQGNRHAKVLDPELVTSLKQINERVVQISLTNCNYWNAHTFALTESGKLYAFGAGDKGQLGIELVANQTERGNPERVEIDLG